MCVGHRSVCFLIENPPCFCFVFVAVVVVFRFMSFT